MKHNRCDNSHGTCAKLCYLVESRIICLVILTGNVLYGRFFHLSLLLLCVVVYFAHAPPPPGAGLRFEPEPVFVKVFKTFKKPRYRQPGRTER